MIARRSVAAVVQLPCAGRRDRCLLRAGVVTTVVYVLPGGCAWRHLPGTFGISSATAQRRFTAWTRAGLWRRLHRAVLDELCVRGELDWASAIVDAASVRAERGHTARTPIGPTHRTSRDRIERAARPVPLEGRAVDRLNVRLPPAYGPMRMEEISRPRHPRPGPARPGPARVA
ncbi:transposase [Streptomyces sp. NPDC050528]|uniref:transposase n=1 Tax=Streptomyces sp. NPDC050528 TaxID=3365623 RepID=UPI00378B9190